MGHEGSLILFAGLLLALGLAASLLAGRLRIPGLVLFLGVGMLVGSDGIGLIAFTDYELARTIGVIALALILFEGGLAAGFQEIRPVLGSAVSLAMLGTLITATVTGLVAYWLLDLTLLQGMLVGAIVSATDGAAIFALLRGSTLKRRLARTLEGEAGMNDPVAVLLVLGFIEWIKHPGYGVADMAVLFVQQLGIGLVAGVAVGWLAVQAFRARAARDRRPVSGRLARRRRDRVRVRRRAAWLGVPGRLPRRSGDGLGAAARAPVGARVSRRPRLGGAARDVPRARSARLPARLDDIAWSRDASSRSCSSSSRGPLAVTVATAFAPLGLSGPPRAGLGRAARSGAGRARDVPRHRGGPDTDQRVLQHRVLRGARLDAPAGLDLRAAREVARARRPRSRRCPTRLVEVGSIRQLGADVVEVEIAEGDAVIGVRVRDLGLPRDALVNVLVRGEEALPPRGATRLEAGDRLHIVARQSAVAAIEDARQRWRTGPVGARAPAPAPAPAGAPIFTTRPWTDADGDPDAPQTVLGREVVERLNTRWDVPGALVVLEDGRYAVTGPHVLVGAREQVQWHARRRLKVAKNDAERAWWQEVIGASAL